MEAHEYFNQELRRLRDRVHKIEGTLRAVELFAQRLEHIERTVEELGKMVSRLATADAIADAVAARVAELDTARSGLAFTRLQSWGIRVAICASVCAAGMEAVKLVLG